MLRGGGDFAGEHAIDEDEVSDGEGDAETPPDETDGEGVMSGGGVVDGDVVLAREGGGQQRGIERRCCSAEHEDDVAAGGAECAALASAEIEAPHGKQADSDREGDEVEDAVGIVVVEGGGTDGGGDGHSDGGE